MQRAMAPLVFVLLIVFAAGCTRYYREVSRLSRRVQVVAYYKCQDPACRTFGLRSHVEILIDGKRKWMLREGRQGLRNVYVGCGRIFALVSEYKPRWRSNLGVLCENGHVAKFWDLTDLLVTRDALIQGLDCEGKSLGSFRVDLDYYRTVNGKTVDPTVRRMSRYVTNLPCTPVVLADDGPPSPPRTIYESPGFGGVKRAVKEGLIVPSKK